MAAAKPVLMKVTMEYDNRIITLEGEAARRWEQNLNDVIVSAHIHGDYMEQHPWVTVMKTSNK